MVVESLEETFDVNETTEGCSRDETETPPLNLRLILNRLLSLMMSLNLYIYLQVLEI